jgi:hypothetical protein
VLASQTAAYTDLDPIYLTLLGLLILAPLLLRLGAARWPALAVPFSFERLVLTTRLTPDECADRLRAFPGTVTTEGFVLHRHFGGWPVAAGTFRQGPTGTTVRVRIGPFAGIWLSMVLVLFALFSAMFGYGRVIDCCSIAPAEEVLPGLVLAAATAGVIGWVGSKGPGSRALLELRAFVTTALSADG